MVIQLATATVAIASPTVKRKFAVRRLIKIVAVVCECGATSHGPGVTNWKTCPQCGAYVIQSKEQRQRDRWYNSQRVDQEIYVRVSGGAA
jgi:hypothetical protein